jgi:hypothetical protein
MPEQSLGALRAAAPGRQGKADAAKAKSLDGILLRTPAVSKFPTMWPREPRLVAATSLPGVIAKGKAKVSRFCSEAPHGAVRSEKAESLWLPKRLFLMLVRLSRPVLTALGAA